MNVEPTPGRPPTTHGDFSLPALLSTIALFCLADGALVALFISHETSALAGFGMFILAGGPLALAFGPRVYRRLRAVLAR